MKGESYMRIIEIVVSPRGESTVQTKGYAGSDCMQASRFLEESLGAKITDNKTSEFYEAATAHQDVRA
jgi:hypothetical protein